MEIPRKTLKVDRRHCPHCDELVSIKTYKVHKRQYYDADSGHWNPAAGQHSDSAMELAENQLHCETPPELEEEDDHYSGRVTVPSPPQSEDPGSYASNFAHHACNL